MTKYEVAEAQPGEEERCKLDFNRPVPIHRAINHLLTTVIAAEIDDEPVVAISVWWSQPAEVVECGCPKCGDDAVDEITNLCRSCDEVYRCSEDHSRCSGDKANP